MNNTTTVNPASLLTFKAASFNIRCVRFPDPPSHWPLRCELIADLIRTSCADIVGVQEMLPSMKRDLRDRLNNYAFVGRGRSVDKKRGLPCSTTGEHTDILTRRLSTRVGPSETFWLSNDPRRPGSKLRFTLLPRICTVADVCVGTNTNGAAQSVRVYNTHLDHISRSARLFQIGVILGHIRFMQRIDPRPIVLMGDLNTTPGSREIGMITEDPSLRLRPVYTGGGHSFKYPAFLGGRLFDHIFVSDDIAVNDAYIDESYHGSDHFPLIASLSLNNTKEEK